MVFPQKFKKRKHLLFLVSYLSWRIQTFVENVMSKVSFRWNRAAVSCLLLGAKIGPVVIFMI